MRMRKKGERGEATLYYSRSKAISKLQVTLPIFRRLCIYKGIYPREPKNRVKAQAGNTQIKELFLKSDINFLNHEPLIHVFRAQKIHNRKVKKYVAKGDKKAAEYHRHYEAPSLSFDHLVRERYPIFRNALQDLEDPLNTLFLYAKLPKYLRVITPELAAAARRLTCEFMYYVIESRSLRKTFISFKGYYYEATIQGIKILWMVPHPFTPQPAEVGDMKVLHWFSEFYTTMLGFVNFKLYQSLNLHYPPQLLPSQVQKDEDTPSDFIDSTVEALSIPLPKECVKDDKVRHEKKTKMKNQAIIFQDKKFFLGRETNRESLTFVIRSGGGLVSWDASSAHGATYDESDLSIEYQVVDRPEFEKKYLNRYYIQPQWVYDSFNEAFLLPVNDYFPGVKLPAHLSPFSSTSTNQGDVEPYLPPEKLRIMELKNEVKIQSPSNAIEITSDVELFTDDQYDKAKLKRKTRLLKSKKTRARGVKQVGLDAENSEIKNKKPRKHESENKSKKGSNQVSEKANEIRTNEEESALESDRANEIRTSEDKSDIDEIPTPDSAAVEDEATENEDRNTAKNQFTKLKVRKGQPYIVNQEYLDKQEAKETIKMREKMVHKKNVYLYKKLKQKMCSAIQEKEQLKHKRMLYETIALGQQRWEKMQEKALENPEKFSFNDKRPLDSIRSRNANRRNLSSINRTFKTSKGQGIRRRQDRHRALSSVNRFTKTPRERGINAGE